MHFIYDFVVRISWGLLSIVALFNGKIRLFVKGRKETFPTLKRAISKKDDVIWMHVASLGEFEQGLPILKKVKVAYPSYKILVTFFSPSGYEVKKNTPDADVAAYLPMDTVKNARKFLTIVRPKLVLFVKYEIWPNYLRELRRQHIPTLLVSALFIERQVYFKLYGGFMRKALRTFEHFFVQDETSKRLLESIGIENISISGDTRLDRVSEILDRDNTLDFMDLFKKEQLCLVAGSTWPEDEALLVDYINNAPSHMKYVLAPHTLKKDKILGLAGAIAKKKMLYSQIDRDAIGDCDVLIIDHIGLLTKIYSYADIAYVGGGFATGLHNTMEPAVFGIPVIIGPNYKGFKEAEELVAQKGILSVKDNWSFCELLKKILENPGLRKKTGATNSAYIAKNKGASAQIMKYIRTLL